MTSVDLDFNKPTVHHSFCMGCVHELHPSMLTGYCLTNCHCSRCGRISDLAMVQLSEPALRRKWTDSSRMMREAQAHAESRANREQDECRIFVKPGVYDVPDVWFVRTPVEGVPEGAILMETVYPDGDPRGET